MEKKNIKNLAERADRTHYTGVFQSFQDFGNTVDGEKYSVSATKAYTEQQTFFYKRAIYGLSVYTREEKIALHHEKKKRIKRVHKRTQFELNLLKQNKVINLTNKILSLFDHSPLAKGLIDNHSETEDSFICNLSLQDLGYTKDAIISKLLDKGLLPNNFSSL